MTMKMKRQLLILLGLLTLSCAVKAQTPEEKNAAVPVVSADYTQQLEQATRKNNELEQKKKDKKRELDEAKDRDRQLTKDQNDLKKVLVQVQKTVKDLNEKLAKTAYPSLVEKKDSLVSVIRTHQEELDQLREQQSQLDEQLEESNRRMAGLAKVKDEVSNHLISEYRPLIGLPFSKVTLDALKQIHEQCLPYTADQQVKAFVAQVDNTIGNRVVYDEIQTVLASPYQKSAVAEAMLKIDRLRNLSDAQQQELLEVKRQLAVFEEGVKTFKEFIGNLNKCREGVQYSMRYFDDDKAVIFRGNLQQRMAASVMIVPYLKRKYEDFMNEFKKNPNKHSDIETEILNQ